jgi:hypothetical protein
MKIALLTALLAGSAAAQALPEPPPLIRVTRTLLPDGSIGARFAGKATIAVLGMPTVSGPAETWMLEVYDSFASLEQTDLAIRPLGSGRGVLGEPFNPAAMSTSWLAVYRPWLSYRPVEASQALFRMRYMQALVFRVNPVDEEAFVEAVKARKVTLDGINLDRPEMAYQVISGAGTITYVFFAPLLSLKSLDEGLARPPVYARHAAKAAAAANLSHENFLLRVEPGLSMVPDALAEADKPFWRPGEQK